MFGRKRIDKLSVRISDMWCKVENSELRWKNLVECEKCGALLYDSVAIRGKSKIKKTECLSVFGHSIKEKIYIPHYCKIHAPNKK